MFDFSEITFFGGLLEGCVEAHLVDGAEAGVGEGEEHPGVLLNPEEFAVEQVHIEAAFCAALRVRYVISCNRFFACNLTNL